MLLALVARIRIRNTLQVVIPKRSVKKQMQFGPQDKSLEALLLPCPGSGPIVLA